jgi:hypothetical protein
MGLYKMEYTIEVKKKRKDEKFSYEDLEIFHSECYGGKLKWVGFLAGNNLSLKCVR